MIMSQMQKVFWNVIIIKESSNVRIGLCSYVILWKQEKAKEVSG